jgi:hypothetical protein
MDRRANALPTGGRYSRTLRMSTILSMEQLARIVDASAVSLDARVARALAHDGAGCVVARFTYWYTGRPPVFEAIVLRPPAA